ncbi:MAG: hypothetical protein WCK93_07495 [Nitrosomonadales bacterium]
MSDLLERLKAGTDAVSDVYVGDVRLGIRVLSESERESAQLAAAAYFKGLEVELSATTVEAFEAEVASQVLLRALVDIETRKPVFVSCAVLKQTLSAESKHDLLNAYVLHERNISPRAGMMPDDEFVSLLETVKKTPQTPRLLNCNGVTLRRLIVSLVSQPSI